MKRLMYFAAAALTVYVMAACMTDHKVKDRTEARELFRRIVSLTRNYTAKVAAAADSAAWADVCLEFEDSLATINFSVPADTDLLLTEGQNDTIHSLTREYILARDRRIDEIMNPPLPVDSLASDSIPIASAGDASRSRGN